MDVGVANQADTIIFPDLSLTGYEPTLAKQLATTPDDARFDHFQHLSDAHRITVGVGVPTQVPAGLHISLVLFQPQQARQTYAKKYLHADEAPFFVSGQSSVGLLGQPPRLALAICYEISVPKHAQNAFNRGATVYVASVAKSVSGVDKALQTLAGIARKYSMTALMANCVGYCDDFECGGQTSAWNNQGLRIGQLNSTDEGLLIVDTDPQAATHLTIG